jgi:hypothetical protein
VGNTAHVCDYLDGLIRVVGVVPDRVAVLDILGFGYHEEALGSVLPVVS